MSSPPTISNRSLRKTHNRRTRMLRAGDSDVSWGFGSALLLKSALRYLGVPLRLGGYIALVPHLPPSRRGTPRYAELKLAHHWGFGSIDTSDTLSGWQSTGSRALAGASVRKKPTTNNRLLRRL